MKTEKFLSLLFSFNIGHKSFIAKYPDSNQFLLFASLFEFFGEVIWASLRSGNILIFIKQELLERNFTNYLMFFFILQFANAMATPDNAASTWNCSSFLVAYQVEFVSDVDMLRRVAIAITAERVSIEIQRSQ